MEHSRGETVGTDPPAIVQLKKLLESSEFEVVSDSGKVLPPKNDVFRRLSDAITASLRKKPQNIYTIILENHYDILTQILQSRNITKNHPTMMNDSLNSTLDVVLEFKLDLTNVWLEMAPETVNYNFQSRGKRELHKLKRNAWTHILYDAIFEETKIPCALKFKTNEVSQSGFYVSITGDCPDCKARFLGRIINAPSENELIDMECFIYGFDRSVKHTTKRQLRGARRIKVAKEMVEGNLLPCNWRRKEGDRLIDCIGDDEPAHIPDGQVLGKAATEMRDKILGLIRTHDVFQSFQDMKCGSMYETSIHSIGFFEFFVHYWSKEQLAVYQKFHKTLYIDGTGSVVRKIRRPSGYSPHIYLYQAVTQANSKTVPVFQMLSAEHHTDAIAKWLFEFLRTGAKETTSFPLPQEVVTDFDKALLGGITRAFAQQSSLRQYLSLCFEYLTGAILTPPVCILRLDICHFINMISKWKCYDGTPYGAKSMCIRAMAVLRQQETISALEAVARQIFFLVLSRSAGSASLSDRARIHITALIKGLPNVDLMKPEAEIETDDESEDSKKEHSSDSKYDELLNSAEEVPTNTWGWAKNIYEECVVHIRNEPKDNTENINAFYNPKFAKHLKNVLPYFPQFSECMRNACQSGSRNATSAAIESEFNDLKNRTLINVRQPLRADRFVATHILSFPGKIKLALAGQSDNDTLLELERWKETNNNDSNHAKRRSFVHKFRYEENEGVYEKDDGRFNETNLSPENSIIIPVGENTSSPRYSIEICTAPSINVEPNEELGIQPIDSSWIATEHSPTLCIQTPPDHMENCSQETSEEPVRHLSEDCRDSSDQVIIEHKTQKRRPSPSKADTETKLHFDTGRRMLPLDNPLQYIEHGSRQKRGRLSVKSEEILDSTNAAVIELKEQHNWRNKNKTTKKPKYTKACPTFDSNNIAAYTSLPLLPNGNYCKNVKDRSTILVVENTCGFDSVCQILAMAVCNNPSYKAIVVNSDVSIFKCIEVLTQKGLVSQVFKERANALLALPRITKEPKGAIIKIRADSNLTVLVEDLFVDIPSYTLQCRCLQCGVETEHRRVLLDVNYNPLTSDGITALHQAVSLGRYVPQKCCGTSTQAVKYGPHLFLDVDTGRNKREELSNVPRDLTVTDGTRYKLAGVVEYQGPKCINSLGHYIGYCWTGSH